MEPTNTSKKQRIIGWIFSGLAILFMLLDSIGKLAKPDAVIKGTLELGYPESAIGTLGIISLVSTVLYIIPRTAFIGAVLLTGFFGGAVATHLRLGNPLFSHILFTVYLGIFVWLGLYLRNDVLRKLVGGATS